MALTVYVHPVDDWPWQVLRRFADRWADRWAGRASGVGELALVRRASFPARQRDGSVVDASLRKTPVFELPDGRLRCWDTEDWVNMRASPSRRFAYDPRCERVLKSQYRAGHYDDVPAAVVPFVYFPKDPDAVAGCAAAHRSAERARANLYFRGNAGRGERRGILAALKGVASIETGSVGMAQYLAECAAHRVMLALPGNGNLTHREFEGFAVGTPVLMPRLKNALHAELYPDWHYVSVDVDTKRQPAAEVAAAIAERYDQVIDDRTYLAAVARRAAAYYDRYVAYPGCLDLLYDLLDLDPVAAGCPDSGSRPEAADSVRPAVDACLQPAHGAAD